MTGVIIGADIGGTSTRVGVAELSGRFLAVVRGGPANPNAVGERPAIAEIRRVADAAVRQAVARSGGPVRATGVVLGLAGVTGLADPASFGLATLPEALRDPSPGADAAAPPVSVVTDLEVAYASGTPEPDGSVLIAGTGAMAGAIRANVMVDRRDGWGWLLGDDGSGFWLGRQAVRATLAELERGGPPGPLARAVLAATGAVPGPAGEVADPAATAGALIRHSYARAPRELSEYAPLVTRLATDDPAAAAIVDRAADRLVRTLAGLDPEPGRPIVVAGSLLLSGPTGATPVGARLREVLAERLDNPLTEAGPGVAGAAWLALPERSGADPRLHARLVGSARAETG